jgi:hypothetical protein
MTWFEPWNWIDATASPTKSSVVVLGWPLANTGVMPVSPGEGALSPA